MKEDQRKESELNLLPSTNGSKVEDSSQKVKERSKKKILPGKRRQSACNLENDDRSKEAEKDPVKLRTDLGKTDDDKDDSCFNLRDIENNCPAIKNLKQSSVSSSPSPLITEHEPKKRPTVIESKDDITAPSDKVLQNQQANTTWVLDPNWVKKFSEILIDHLNQFGVCVIDGFLGPDRGARILNEVLQLQETTPFKVNLINNK